VLVVLDAGVFVSAVITPGGIASRIVTAGVEGRFDYLLCPRLVGELVDVLSRPKIVRLLRGGDRERFLTAVVAAGRDANDPTVVPAVSRDPDDDYLLALAHEHHAERIVTGDGDLLTVVDPSVPTRLRDFLELLAANTP
jgi:putative PIN family toxin of toxin-antitoxin system